MLELFIHEDPARANAIHGEIDANKATITDALAILDRLIVLPEGKELLATLKQQRKAYVVSFSQADKLLMAGQRAEAAVHVRDDTLPALNRLQKTVNQLNELQRASGRAWRPANPAEYFRGKCADGQPGHSRPAAGRALRLEGHALDHHADRVCPARGASRGRRRPEQ